jgi:DNA-directed RNA polymerase specialized sigma24 family protein
MKGCKDVARLGTLGLDGTLQPATRSELADHVRSCSDCTTYIGQMATVSALLALRSEMSPNTGALAALASRDADATSEIQRLLYHVARGADPLHADDLVQETWDMFLEADPQRAVSRQDLISALLERAEKHEDEPVDGNAWADHLDNHRSLTTPGTGSPAGQSRGGDLRLLAELDALDADADRAELYFPDFFDFGTGSEQWEVPPNAWQSVTRLLSPDAEFETTELYRIVDDALDELPDGLEDIVRLVDLEGRTLAFATAALGLDPTVAQAQISRAQNHLRGRVDTYLTGLDTRHS